MAKHGLVVEGGGMRGIYAAGVLDVLMENQIGFDGVIGVSAGAIFGSSFVSGQHGRSIRFYKKYCGDERFMSFKSMIKTGSIIGTQFCYHDLPETLDPFDYEAFEKSQTKFYVTCTNLETGKAEYMEITDMKKQMDLMRASASLPCVSEIVEYEGKKLLDGGCTDSIPVRAFQRMGYEKNVVVLTRHDGYVKEPQKMFLPNIIYRKYPRFCYALSKRHIRYNRTTEDIRKQQEKGKIFVICPSMELKIPRLTKNAEEIQAVYDIGRQDALKALQPLKVWLEDGMSALQGQNDKL